MIALVSDLLRRARGVPDRRGQVWQRRSVWPGAIALETFLIVSLPRLRPVVSGIFDQLTSAVFLHNWEHEVVELESGIRSRLDEAWLRSGTLDGADPWYVRVT